ncbi:hypothetical protein GCM10011507_09300 [Edaphobacter acidisoli]|uniref:DUF4082 domain-containing protein n=1 Tax=Edaphobacter acidisoli TaxID=2040573 RepID=A0A916RKC9_9BACT|nr:DUF4082 domain-containing protein [Edaphobacter acidisoli]GGA59895.1 hypothetical protein GCM10011507_09300 [Edaphobacter acidisoli]
MKRSLGSHLFLAAAFLAVALPAVPSFADGIQAFSFTSAVFRDDDPGTAELGYTFTVGNNPIVVDSLGYINDVYQGTHTIAIFDVATQQMVPGALATVTTPYGSAIDTYFTYTALSTPVTLAANTEYQIVSQFFAGEYYFTDAEGFTSAPGVTFGIASYGNYGDPPSIPVFATGSYAGNDPGDFGPNFTFTPVPEPSSICLVVSGICGLAATGLRRLKR